MFNALSRFRTSSFSTFQKMVRQRSYSLTGPGHTSWQLWTREAASYAPSPMGRSGWHGPASPTTRRRSVARETLAEEKNTSSTQDPLRREEQRNGLLI